ncbi:RING-H2 finger protein ATL57 [Spatholobus suberectus]|nr:RING-H2 finger protein ATL57 [Spatholobus suberectus]
MASEQQHYHFIQWHLDKLNASTFHSYSQSLFLLLWFIVILIFVPSLFLCIHFCRRRFSQQQSSTTTAVVSPLPDHQWVGIDFTNHTMVPSLTSMVGAGFEQEECCICLSPFQGDEKLKVLVECEHVFHSECLDMWLSAHPTCPLCRASFHVSENLKK